MCPSVDGKDNTARVVGIVIHREGGVVGFREANEVGRIVTRRAPSHQQRVLHRHGALSLRQHRQSAVYSPHPDPLDSQGIYLALSRELKPCPDRPVCRLFVDSEVHSPNTVNLPFMCM